MKNTKSAFSLIELSWVILVTSIIAVGVLSLQTSNVIINKSKTTSDKIGYIYQALKVYTAVNNRLPCPASMAVAANNTNYGLEGNCTASTGIYKSGNIVYGMLPIKALGISSSLAIDDFGNKFAYIVDSTFTIAASPSNFADPNVGGIAVNRYSSPSIVANEPNALFAIISYGNNKKGAVPALATSALSSNLSTDADEVENGSENFNATLISGSDRSGSTFDDMVFFKNKKYFLQEANLQFSIGINNNSSQSQSTLPTCTITGIAGFNNQTSLTYATSSTAIPSACQTGYSGSPTYTCTTSGPATISGSCSAITCTSTSGIGYNAQSNLPYATSGSGTFSCDIPGYSGIKNYTCTTAGVASITGGTCSATTCTAPAGTGYDAQSNLPYATSGSGTFSCAAGYSGVKNYTCTTAGVASITGGTCSSACVATGGTNDSITVPGSMIHIFTSSGSLTCSGAQTAAKILVVAAGGAGGGHISGVAGTGGGGGGGVVYVASTTLPAATYNINVAGKTNGTTNSGCSGLGAKGANSTFSGSTISITANGGGGGGGCNTGKGSAGGSGGGGHWNSIGGSASGGSASGVSATISANNGGFGTSSNPAGGGGGGAGGDGGSGSGGTAGGGGTGISYDISGSTWVFGSGGGGNGSTGGTGGTNAGNGISGTSSSRTGIDAVANRGGGGGGGGNSASNIRSGDGGSGIVIIRY